MKMIIFALIVLVCSLQYKLWFSAGGVAEAWGLHNAVASSQIKNKNLSDRNAALAAEVRDLKHGEAAIEERARNELGMIQKGEVFYQVVK